jgi:hypothetical protein
MVNMPLVTVFTVRTVRLDARQAHGAASAVWAFPMIEIRGHGDALSLIPLPPPMVNAFRDASFLIRAHDRRRTFRIFVVAQTSKRFRGIVPDLASTALAVTPHTMVSRQYGHGDMDKWLAHMMPDNVVLHHPAISPFSPRLPRHRRS